MEPSEQSIGIYVGIGIGIFGALVFLAIHVIGMILFIRASNNDTTPATKIAVAAWAVSGIGGLMGPCVMPMNFVALVLGVIALRGEPSEQTRVIAKTAIFAATTILLMTGAMIAVIIPSLP